MAKGKNFGLKAKAEHPRTKLTKNYFMMLLCQPHIKNSGTTCLDQKGKKTVPFIHNGFVLEQTQEGK